MDDTAPTIRRATLEDGAALRALAQATFVDTFRHYPPADLAGFLPDYAAKTEAALGPDAKSAAWVLEQGSALLGYVIAGPCTLPHPEVAADDGEIKRLYVVRERFGRGWGRELLRVALAWLDGVGSRPVWLGVWSENLAAQRFYARHGFVEVGTYIYPVGTTRDHELIFRRDALTPSLVPPASRAGS